MHEGQLILVAGALLSIGLLASLLADRVRVPGLVAVLGCGMLIGSEGLGWIDFADYEVARGIGIVALALILFEGGLAAGWPEIRPVIVPSLMLAILGTLATAVITGLFATWLFDLGTLQGLLIGSVVAATDGAATFALLRGSTLRRRVARTLEGESGFNDPVAVLLVLGFIEWIKHPGYGVVDMLGLFAQQMGIGIAAGVLVGALAVFTFTRVKLASAGLYPVASLAVVALAFGSADVLHGSGFLAVYLAGLALGGADSPAKRTVTTFHDGMAWVAQIALFFTLGLLVFPSSLGDVALKGTALALILMFVARPAASLATTIGMKFSLAERTVIGWAGLRGAVPVVLATFPVIEHVGGATEIFNIVFFAVLLSTIVQGTTFEALAGRLGVTTDEAAVPQPLINSQAVSRLGAEVVEIPVTEAHAVAGHRVRELGLPRDALLNLIIRDDQAIPPRGSTRVLAGDRLHVLVRQEVAVEFRHVLRRWREGPMQAGERPLGPATSTLFSSRPWRAEDGDPARPQALNGVEIVERLRTRRDVPGALVALSDGRYAVTGPVVSIGPPRALRADARYRLTHTSDDSAQAWWREVIGALAR